MSMLALFDLEAPEWVPIVKQLGYNLVSYIADDLCRDCGAKANYNQGGAGNGGAYMVCDECAQLDQCTTRAHSRGPEWHVSHWGDSHLVTAHEGLVAAQQKRRARYLARHESQNSGSS